MPINMPKNHPEASIRKLVCGGCQWFTAGYEGEDCRKLRDVEATTTACIEFKPIFSDPYHDASSDKFIAGIRTKLTSNYFLIDPKVIVEIKGYVVNLETLVDGMGRNAEFNALNSALKKVVAYRARVTDILSDCIELKSHLNRLVDQANMWLYSKYEVFRELKNDKQRQAGFDRVIPEYSPVATQMDILIKTVELVDGKLDKQERTIKSILESNLKLVYSTDRIKNG